MISERSKQEILEAAKIEEVIGDFVNLKRRGSNMLGLCPFHPEKTPSFAVSPSKNLFKCFGCGKAGDSVTFLMEHEHYTFPEALRYLADKFGIKIEEKEFSPEELAVRQLNESLFLVNEYALKYYQEQLFNSDRGRSVGLSYFKSRGFREDVIRKFGLGFAPETGDALTLAAQKEGYSLEHLQKLGLTTERQRDFFRNRVMFTIHNQSGKPVGFAGRILTKDPKSPKYINSPESEIYNKSRILYGMFFAQRAIRKEDECILVEGYTDVLSLYQGGIENVVASSGTSLTVEQVRLVKRFTPNLKMLYDGDMAGRKAALRGSDLALEQDLNVRVVLLPEGEDPDSYLRNVGPTVFADYLQQNAEDFILFKTRSLLEDAGHDPIRRTAVAKDVLSSVARIPDALKRAMYIKECARLLEMEESSLHSELNKQIRQNLQKKLKGSPGTAPSETGDFDLPSSSELTPEEEFRLRKAGKKEEEASKDDFAEFDIARVLINYGDKLFETDSITVAEYIINNLGDVVDEIEMNLFQEIVRAAMNGVRSEQVLNPQFFLDQESDEIRKLAVDILQSEYELSPGWESRFEIYPVTPDKNFFKDAVNSVFKLKFNIIRKVMKRNHEEMKGVTDIEEINKLLLVHNELKEMEKILASELGIVVPPK